MWKKFILLGAILALMSLASMASADWLVDDTQTWPTMDLWGQTGTITATGHLTVTGRSGGGDAGLLVIEGVLDYQAYRFDMDDMTIRVLGQGQASFEEDFKVCDNNGPGIFEILGGSLTFTDVENRQAERGGHILMGAGDLYLVNSNPGDEHRDMNVWRDQGLFQLADGYCDLVIEPWDVNGQHAYATPRPELRIMTPDFIESEWWGPVDCFASAHCADVILDVRSPNDILDELLLGDNPDVAMVWDPWLEQLDVNNSLERLSLENAYWPVYLENEIVGVRLPWTVGWSAVIPTAALEQGLALDLLRDSCVWQRPMNQTEEYRVLGDLLGERGYTLRWEARTEIEREIGGIPLEIVVVPTDVNDTNYYNVVIARDEKGKTFSQFTRQTEVAKAKAAVVSSPTMQQWGQGFVSSATWQTMFDSFIFSDNQVMLYDGQGKPGYCSKAKQCIDLGKVGDCIQNLGNCILDWLSDLVSEAELANLRMQGLEGRTVSYNPAHAWGSRLRAWKLYQAMLNGDGKEYQHRWGDTHWRAANDITRDDGWKALLGFYIEGKMKYKLLPTGYRSWSNTGYHMPATTPRVFWLGDRLWRFAGNSTEYCTTVDAPFIPSMVFSDSGDGDPNESELTNVKGIDIGYTMDYDPYSNVLSVHFSSYGHAEYGIYQVCVVRVVAGGEADAQAKLDGTEVRLNLRLDAYLEGECGGDLGHEACFHGQIGGGIGIVLDIYYPTACKCVVEVAVQLGWGGHGEALSLSHESCDVVEACRMKLGEYDICDPDEQINIDLYELLGTYEDFTDLYGGPPVTDVVIKSALDDYEVYVGTSGSGAEGMSYEDDRKEKTAIYTCRGAGLPYADDWTHRTGIHTNVFIDPVVAVGMLVPAKVDIAEQFVAPVNMTWVEDLYSGTIEISYDPVVLSVTDVNNGKIGLVDILVTNWYEVQPGRVFFEFEVPRNQGVTGSGYLAQVSFTPNCGGQSQIAFTNSHLLDYQGQPIEPTWNRSVTTVEWAADVDGDCGVGFSDLREVAEDWLDHGFGGIEPMVVEDFESYDSTSQLLAAWVPEPLDNMSITLDSLTKHGGEQAMRYEYHHGWSAEQPWSSEVTRDFGEAQDWSNYSMLTLWFKGDASNDEATMYLALKGPNDVHLGQANYPGGTKSSGWVPWKIDISRFGPLSSVKKVVLGLVSTQEDVAGTMHFDDLVLDPPCLVWMAGDINGDCRTNLWDFAHMAVDWLQRAYVPMCWSANECAGQPNGDATCDGSVNLADLFALKAHFGKCAPWTPPECCADFTQDGCINLAELFALKAGFGTSGYSPSTGNQNCD